MDFESYLSVFQKAAEKIDKQLLSRRQMEVATGIVLNAVFLKLYKKAWANPFPDPLTACSRIFFSIWINDPAIKQQKIFYNIHALKPGQLKGYSIQSRKFASVFRKSFEAFQPDWQNVSVAFGPQTLMEGWIKIDLENFQSDILQLANHFLEIEYLIDNALAGFKKSRK